MKGDSIKRLKQREEACARFRQTHPGYDNWLYHNNKESRLQKKFLRRQALKKQVLLAYGGKCACCGETQIEFLTIDHIHGGGHQHCKMLKGDFYVHLRRERFPGKGKEYQVLCMNCNFAKGKFGLCPHQRTTK